MTMEGPALATDPTEERHVGLVVDVEEGPHRDGAQGKDDDRREGEVDGGEAEEVLGSENRADAPHPEDERAGVEDEIVERPEEDRVGRGGGHQEDEHHGEDAQIARVLARSSMMGPTIDCRGNSSWTERKRCPLASAAEKIWGGASPRIRCSTTPTMRR